MLATWKAGGIMVSISPMLKHKELSAQLADSGASALVTFESLWDEVARDVVGRHRRPDRDHDLRAGLPRRRPRRCSRARGETATRDARPGRS